MKTKFYQFSVEPLDFRVKRLGLTHQPKVQGTIPGGTFNEINEALHRLRLSFLPKTT